MYTSVYLSFRQPYVLWCFSVVKESSASRSHDTKIHTCVSFVQLKLFETGWDRRLVRVCTGHFRKLLHMLVCEFCKMNLNRRCLKSSLACIDIIYLHISDRDPEAFWNKIKAAIANVYLEKEKYIFQSTKHYKSSR